MTITQPRETAATILTRTDHDEPSLFVPENLLREARRQRGLPPGHVPAVCLLDPDGDMVRYLVREGRAERSACWACYHTDLWEAEHDGLQIGIVGCAVGAPFAVLVAEQLFASGCELLVSITSAGQVAPDLQPPCFILIDRALRGEGTSSNYLPPAAFIDADPTVMERVTNGLVRGGIPVLRGATWTTDAPFRETRTALEAAAAAGVLAVEMEAAALYAFGQARNYPVVCFAHVTNQMAQIDGDFEKGPFDGAEASLTIATVAAEGWLQRP